MAIVNRCRQVELALDWRKGLVVDLDAELQIAQVKIVGGLAKEVKTLGDKKLITPLACGSWF